MTLLGGVGLLLLGACGGGGSSSSSSSSSSAVAKVGGSVSVWAVWSGAEQAAFKQVLTGFQDQSGATADFQSKGDQLPTVLGTAITGGAPPDVAILPQVGLLHDLVKKGALKPIDSFAGDAVSSNFPSVWKNLAMDGGKLYGVYFKAANKSTVWYNTKAFANAGISAAPKTWDELVADANTLKQSGVTPFSMCGGSGWTLTDWFENIYLQTAGADNYNKLAQHQIPWTDPTVTAAFQKLNQIFGDPSNFVGGYEAAVSTPFPDCVNSAFGPNSKAAMLFEGDFVGTTIKGIGGLQPGTDYNFFPFPSIGSGGLKVSGGGDVAVMLRDTPQAQALMKYLASPEAGAIWAKLGGFVSPNKNVPLSSYPDDVSKALAKAVTDAGDNVVFDLSDQAPAAFGGTAGSGEWADLQNWLRKPTDIPTTVAKLEADAKAAYGH